MAKTISTNSIDYFSFDVDFFEDEKIQFVTARFGTTGEALVIRLLCKIYRNGYYTKFDNDTALLFSRQVGESIGLAIDVVNELVKRDFFDKSIFSSFSVLTSKGILKRFIEATQRRTENIFIKEFLTLNTNDIINAYPSEINKKLCNVYILPYNAYINKDDVNIFLQSKVKYSKIKESKEDTPPLAPFFENNCPTLDALIDYSTKEYPSEDKKRITAIAHKYYSMRKKDNGFFNEKNRAIADVKVDFDVWLSKDLSKKIYTPPVAKDRNDLTSRGIL